MICDNCGSNERVVYLSAKCSDLFSLRELNDRGFVYDGYVPDGCGIGNGDYVKFKYCLECGKIQGKFPVSGPFLEDE